MTVQPCMEGIPIKKKTLCASLPENLLTGKVVTEAVQGMIATSQVQGTIRASQHF